MYFTDSVPVFVSVERHGGDMAAVTRIFFFCSITSNTNHLGLSGWEDDVRQGDKSKKMVVGVFFPLLLISFMAWHVDIV